MGTSFEVEVDVHEHRVRAIGKDRFLGHFLNYSSHLNPAFKIPIAVRNNSVLLKIYQEPVFAGPADPKP